MPFVRLAGSKSVHFRFILRVVRRGEAIRRRMKLWWTSRPQERREMKEEGKSKKEEVINRPRVRARGLDVDGVCSCKRSPLRPRGRTGARTRERLLCTWREAVKAADYVLEHFGNRDRDRAIWVWYCRRIGLDTFLDIADEVISSARQGELRWPIRAFHRHLQEALPKGPSVVGEAAKEGK